MYIKNFDRNTIDSVESVAVGSKAAEYLIEKGFPVLARNGNKFIFSKTKRLILSERTFPWYVRLSIKSGG